MRIKLSKSQWEQIGRQAGWVKTAQQSQVDQGVSNFKKQFNADATFRKGLTTQQIQSINAATSMQQIMDLLGVNGAQVQQVMQRLQTSAKTNKTLKLASQNGMIDMARKWGALGLLALTMLSSPSAKGIMGFEEAEHENPDTIEEQFSPDNQIGGIAAGAGSPPPSYQA